MKQILGIAAQVAGWFSLAYLGYWVALLLDDLLLRLTLYPLLGAPVADWRLTAFRASLSTDLNALPFSPWFRSLLPLLLESLFLAFLAFRGRRLSRPSVSIWLHYAGLWVVLLVASQVALFAYLGRGRFVPLLAPMSGSVAGRSVISVVALVLLIAVGALVAGRLTEILRGIWRFGSASLGCARDRHHKLPAQTRISSQPEGCATFTWIRLAMLTLPILFVLAGSFAFRFRFIGIRGTFSFFIPAGFCLLLGLLGLRWTGASGAALRLRSGQASSAPTAEWRPFLPTGAMAATALALLLATALAQANRAEALLAEQRLASYSTAHYEIRYDPARFSAEWVRTFGQEREQVLARLASRLRYAGDAEDLSFFEDVRIRVVLFPDFASKRAATSSDRPYNVEGTTIRALLYGYIERLDPAADAAALLHAAWGPSSSPTIEQWVARLLAGEWRGSTPLPSAALGTGTTGGPNVSGKAHRLEPAPQGGPAPLTTGGSAALTTGRTVEDWTAQVEGEVGHYPLAELFPAEGSPSVSPLVREPLGAAWIGYVYAHYGLGAVRKLYSSKEPVVTADAAARVLQVSSPQLEQEWAAWTHQLTSQFSRPAQTSETALPEEFLRGVSFSHEGFGGRRGGYVDPEAVEQLRKLQQIGGNAISVIPYGFMRDIQVPAITFGLTDETDEELTQALYTAHQLGLRVMLKPQIWVSRGQFTGQIRFDDPTRRAEWMRNYREFILHYARLAELEGFDLLCIGNELEGMTVYEGEWRRLIAEVRRVYHGPVTYAANWGHEFETLRFWDAVDLIGLNNYYPLTEPLQKRAATRQPLPDSAALAGARALAVRLDKFHAKWRKPILFTEVGYPSVRGGTGEPWIEDASRGLAPGEQAAGYNAIFEAFANRPWLHGMFWWKWPSHGRGSGPQDPSFVPLGKPAEQVLRTWYSRLAANSGNHTPGTP